MAKKVGKVGGLAAKLGTAGRKAFEDHKDDEVQLPRGGDLPPGIENGIAQLVDCRIGQFENGDNKGEYFFIAAGIVVEPKIHGKIPVEGLRTQIGPEPLCETKSNSDKARTSIDDHVAWVINELKKLGVQEVDIDSIEDVCAALVEAKPYFRFRTWQGKPTDAYPNPSVKHTWAGEVEYEETDDESSGVVDETPEPEPEVKSKETKAAVKKTTPKADVKPATTSVKGKKPVDFSKDLDGTASKANEGDEAAGEYLKKSAMDLGYPEDEIDNASSWEVVVEMINKGPNTSEEEKGVDYLELGRLADDDGDADATQQLIEAGKELGIDADDHSEKTWTEFAQLLVDANDSGEEDWAPAVDEVYKMTYSKAKPAAECTILAVFPEKETVNVKNLDDGKTYKGVAWASIERE